MNRTDRERLHQYAAKKAFEISYALVRMGANTRHKTRLTHHLEDQSYELIRAASAEDMVGLRNALRATLLLLRLGVESGALHGRHGSLVEAEIEKLDRTVADRIGSDEEAAFGLEDIFTSDDDLAETGAGERVPMQGSGEPPDVMRDKPAMQYGQVSGSGGAVPKSGKPAKSSPITDPSHATLAHSGDAVSDEKREIDFINAAVASQNPSEIVDSYADQSPAIAVAKRQSAIVERIRQSAGGEPGRTGNPAIGRDGCQFREIQEIFPDVSERTLRYDLYRLMEQGVIERIGQGGPGSSYRIRTTHLV